jgi:hypothetical protein
MVTCGVKVMTAKGIEFGFVGGNVCIKAQKFALSGDPLYFQQMRGHSKFHQGSSTQPLPQTDDLLVEQRKVDALATELNITKHEEWYRIREKDVVSKSGIAGLLNQYGSLYRLLRTVYPDYYWKMWKFGRVDRGFWQDSKNQKHFFDDIAQQLELKSMEDWYKVTPTQIRKLIGGGLFRNYFGDSLIQALKKVYPDFQWQSWKFSKVHRGFWKDSKNTDEYMSWMQDQLGITDLKDWNDVTNSQFRALKGGTLVQRNRGILSFLSKRFPEQEFTDHPLNLPVSKSQKFLFKSIKLLFPDDQVELCFKHPTLVFPRSSRKMEFDVFLPKLSLAFEYQGQQHFHQHFFFGSQRDQQLRDSEKREACASSSITLFEIPFWWNNQTSSLAATICKVCPGSSMSCLFNKESDLKQRLHVGDGVPIPEEQPAIRTRAKKQS